MVANQHALIATGAILGAMILAMGCTSPRVDSPVAAAGETQETSPSRTAWEHPDSLEWSEHREMISDLLAESPMVNQLPPLSGSLSLHRIEGTLIACGLWHGMLFDEGRGSAWVVRSSGFAGIVEYFGPIDAGDPRVQALRKRSMPVAIGSIPLASGL